MSLLSEKLAPIWSAINRLQARQMSIFPATVTDTNPVRIRIDGEERSLAASPASLDPIMEGDRVRVLRYGTTHLVLGTTGAVAGAASIRSGTAHLWDGRLQWFRTFGGLVVLTGHVTRTGGSMSGTATSSLFDLPPRVRPLGAPRAGIAVRTGSSPNAQAVYAVEAELDGVVRVYNTDPGGWGIDTGAALSLHVAYYREG